MGLTLVTDFDRSGWDNLVRQSGATVFSLSAYLDATADNWCVLYNEDRSGGIACPYTVKLGVKVLYAPFFHRYLEWTGANPPSPEELKTALTLHFPVADANLKPFDGIPEGTKIHQQVDKTSFQPNQQSKRMLKKAVVYTINQGRRQDELLQLLKRELSPRVASIDSHSLQLLEQLVSGFDDGQLIQLNLLEGTTWKGAIWLLPFNGRMLYLKGTVEPDAKNNGGMYLLMEHAIGLAFEHDLVFDFGGSNVEGVRRFNLNWGANDVAYAALHWNNAPLWWKMLKTLRHTWNNRSSS
jgi:hypothetical protein